MMGFKKALLVTAVIILTLFAASGCSRTVTREQFLEAYQIRSGTIIEVYNQNGTVTISGWDQNKVEIAAVKESFRGQAALDEVEIFIDIAEKLVIQTVNPDDSAQVTVSYEIKVPEDLVIGIIECSNGNINIDNVTGNPDISTSNGTIIVNGVNGIVSARSSNGSLTITGVKSLGNLRTSNGNIEAELFILHDDLEIGTSNGSVSLALSTDLQADIEANTSNGTISASNLNIVAAELEQASLVGTMNGGGNKITIKTSNGSINLVPLR
ncbi:MAG: DUF4097 domain-containing protein [Clostridia bacterium]|nr:DUF4097 domain-containing protein [Clostridia bacterium]